MNKRIKALYEYVRADDIIIADIGCDHGYFALECLNDNPDRVIICSDINQMPLNVAKSNILKKYNNHPSIQFRLGDGLSVLDEIPDVICIAGMGGYLISDILNKDLRVAQKTKKILLQPNTDIEYLRKYLLDNCFEIIHEKIILDANKYYFMLKTKYLGKNIIYNHSDIMFGPILRLEKNPEYINYWCYQLKTYEDNLGLVKDLNEKMKLQAKIDLIKENL